MRLEAGGKAGARVEEVAECVADEVEGEDGEHDGEGSEDDHVGASKGVGAGVVENRAQLVVGGGTPMPRKLRVA